MIDKIKLSIFEKLHNGYLNKLEETSGVDADDEDTFIYNTLVKDAGTNEINSPRECLHYSKANLDDEELLFGDISGLKKLEIHISDGFSGSKTRKSKKSTKSDKSCDGSENKSIIGTCMTIGFDDYQHPTIPDIYSLKDLFKSVQYLISEKDYKLGDFKILTLRRHLHLLLKVPIRKQPIQFNVIYWQGLVLFAYDWEPEVEYEKENPSNGIELLLQYSGMNFENILCDDEDNTKSRYYSVVNNTVNDIPLLYSAEIDCSIDSEPGLSNYVELKTHSKLLDEKIKTINKLNKKLLEAYCQNKLIGCQNLVLGFRTLDFKLASIKTYKTSDVANIINNDPIFLRHGCTFNTKELFRWYDLVIQWLVSQEKNVEIDKPSVFRLSFEREVEMMDSYLNLTKIENKLESQRIFNQTVPEWFQSFVTSQKA
ncbi:Decapping nuclease RAI1 [Spathaspora sp. JA1]|nr:Decapping nuclease RAI1 [Spathaspora sp. JA1]